MEATRIVEAVLFASNVPLSADEIARVREDLDEEAVESALAQLRLEYDADRRAFEIVDEAGGHQILTRPEFAPYLDRVASIPRTARLSRAALEALAIVAYRQPIGRVEIEYIRGVGSAGVLRTLVDRGLLGTVGRGEGLGRPLLYGTTDRFLSHFGFRSLEDLPKPDDLGVILDASPTSRAQD